MKLLTNSKSLNISLAEAMLRAGRPVRFTKFITGITMAEMIRQKWLHEVTIPDPKGWEGGDPKTGEGATHNGHMLHTGNYRSVYPAPSKVKGKSNRQLKREKRKLFFESRRLKSA